MHRANGLWSSAAGAALALLSTPVHPADEHAAGADITQTRRYYELDATLLDPLRRQLAERAQAAGLAGGAIGRTRQTVETHYRLEPLPTGCRLDGEERLLRRCTRRA